MGTIVAISTAPGVGGIGIVRMSGNDCFEILNKIFVPKHPKKIEDIKGYTIKYGNIINKNNEIIDEVLVSYFKAPNSYTTENMCEINSHGGIVILNEILRECLNNGAIIAEPGEFTKKAFLNGRMDLSQAEAVIDVINSKTEKESKISIEQLQGFLSNKIKDIRNELLDLVSDIEANIDYPEYDIEEVTTERINNVLDNVSNKLFDLENSFSTGKILREGIKTAIIGRPNAGKSSLLNCILKEDRAIVTEIEGTTRDTSEEFIQINGVPLKIIDTAGIRETEDSVEKIGVDKALEIAKNSDIIIAIFDISKELNNEDYKILKLIKNKNSIIVLNKVDLKAKAKIPETYKNKPIIKISAKENKGIEDLYKEISKIFNLDKIANNGETIISNERHKSLIRSAANEIKQAKESINNKMPYELISTNILNALTELGKITGESVTDDVIKEIFSKFCLGK